MASSAPTNTSPPSALASAHPIFWMTLPHLIELLKSPKCDSPRAIRSTASSAVMVRVSTGQTPCRLADNEPQWFGTSRCPSCTRLRSATQQSTPRHSACGRNTTRRRFHPLCAHQTPTPGGVLTGVGALFTFERRPQWGSFASSGAEQPRILDRLTGDPLPDDMNLLRASHAGASTATSQDHRLAKEPPVNAPPSNPDEAAWHKHPYRPVERFWDPTRQMWTAQRRPGRKPKSHREAVGGSATRAADASRYLLRRPVFTDWVVWFWIIGVTGAQIWRAVAAEQGFIAIPQGSTSLPVLSGFLLGTPLALRSLNRPVARDWVFWLWVVPTGGAALPLTVWYFSEGGPLNWYPLYVGSALAVLTLLFLVVPAFARYLIRKARGLPVRVDRRQQTAPTAKYPPLEAEAPAVEASAPTVARPRPHEPSATNASQGAADSPPDATGLAESPVALLEQLKRLHEIGAITDVEWASKRGQVLERL